MARGITETDVHTAADELVAAGERPTVERIRAHLGTGSPNTVTRWLETWWRGLGRRLQAQQIHLDVPAAPEVVAALAGEWWGRALAAARDESAQALATERSALLQEREALDDERTRLAAEASALRAALEAARHSEQLAQAQTTELQRLVDQLQLQVQELAQQRDVALARGQELEVAREALQRHLQQAEETARTERESLTQHLRAVENRAHTEVDRARQETKELSSKLSALDKERTSVERRHREQLEEARKATAEIQQGLAGQRARADGLEAQLDNLRSLPLALEAALRTRSPAKPKTAGRKTKVRGGSGTP